MPDEGFDSGFYQGGGLSQLVPSLYPVALDGHPYLVDLKSGAFKRQSIQLLRTQADTSNLPGEQSINPEDLWRRGQETWHHGAGQESLDRPDSDSSRFFRSKGIDVWTKWNVSLLKDTERKVPSTTNVNQNLLAVGTRLYWADGATLKFTTDPTGTSPTWTTVTGTGANPISGLATDGYNIYIAQGSNGLYISNRTISTASSWATGTANIVNYVTTRLMVGQANVLYNPTGSGALVPYYTHSNTDFVWTGFAAGQGQIYACGFSGDKSIVYRITIRQDGTALDIPIVAVELPDGEIARSIQGYLGFVVIGTDKGVRFATQDGQGNLTLGSLIRTASAVLAFEPQDRFVWFGWSNYDGFSTGLGRLDLSVFVAPLTPAYASDLMVTTQGVVTSVVTFNDRRYFTVSAYGLVGETTNLVASGTLESGKITYGIPDTKVGMFLQARHLPLAGSVTLGVSIDGGNYIDLGINNTALSTITSLPVGERAGEYFSIRSTLARAGGLATGPTLTRHTLRAYPGPIRGEIIILPLLLHETLEIDGLERYIDPQTELNWIRALVNDHRLVVYQEAERAVSVFVEDYEWSPHAETLDGRFWNGTCIVKLKAVTDI